jgi:hypothetical protein
MKCVRGEDDYNGQKDFVNDLCSFAQDSGVHVHLVHHVRKGESEHKAPGKFDIRGAGSITDLVDNVFIVWRNKRAEEKERRADGCSSGRARSSATASSKGSWASGSTRSRSSTWSASMRSRFATT